MNINRRVFFSLLFARSVRATSVSVRVLEVFDNEHTWTAALVHHTDYTMRNTFADWLQSHPHSPIRVRTGTGKEVAGTIFRVRMCFGRGLIVFPRPTRIRERDVLTILQ